jgi:hypothetical protein
MHHRICLTIDTDPDGLSGHTINRASLVWQGLHTVIDQLYDHFERVLIPARLTWFVRADGQLQDIYGDALWLLHQHETFWRSVQQRGDEIGWHPHLYRQPNNAPQPTIISDPLEAEHELNILWQQVNTFENAWRSFRMGEGWQAVNTYRLIESLGFTVDSSALPGRSDNHAFLRDWSGVPNQPYFPAETDIKQVGQARSMLEIPMNTWRFQASYDTAPKLRYMNPCIHSTLWEHALDDWQAQLPSNQAQAVWVLIWHPEECVGHREDLLYGHSLETLSNNLQTWAKRITIMGDTFEYNTLSEVNTLWRK